jgi:multidrug resistance efflux pump
MSEQLSPIEQEAATFRQEALDHYLERENAATVLRISPPSIWILFWIISGVMILAIVASFLARVEVTATGPGILRPRTGVRLLITQTSGVVTQVFARSGQFVRAQHSIVQLDSPPLRAELLEAEERIQSLRTDLDRFGRGSAAYTVGQRRSIENRIAILEAQISSFDETIATRQRKYEADKSLVAAGLLSAASAAESGELVENARRERRQLEAALSQASQELGDAAYQSDQTRAAKEAELREAVARRDRLTFALRQLNVVAPADGHVDAILVRPGDVLQNGSAVGKLIPAAPEMQVISFVPERDRAFITPGDPVRIELDQLPWTEFGTLSGHVLRISSDLASQNELKDAFAEQSPVTGPAYRVEVSLDRPRRELPLRPGMHLTVHYTLRRQRLITIIFQPLQRWMS